MKGRHILADVYGVWKLDDIDFLESVLVEAARDRGAEILSVQRHKFQPQGCTVIVMLAESHISIHTTPESDYAGLDVFTCGERVSATMIMNDIISKLMPQTFYQWDIFRGLECNRDGANNGRPCSGD